MFKTADATFLKVGSSSISHSGLHAEPSQFWQRMLRQDSVVAYPATYVCYAPYVCGCARVCTVLSSMVVFLAA